jgi:hypothetical protein
MWRLIMTSPPACPCGDIHELSAATRGAYENKTPGLPETVTIAVDGRAWLVPRIYLAAHGVKADELPALAERYGFAPAPTFTCPCCGKETSHPTDIDQRYCGLCHWWTGDPDLGPPHLAAPCPERRGA